MCTDACPGHPPGHQRSPWTCTGLGVRTWGWPRLCLWWITNPPACLSASWSCSRLCGSDSKPNAGSSVCLSVCLGRQGRLPHPALTLGVSGSWRESPPPPPALWHLIKSPDPLPVHFSPYPCSQDSAATLLHPAGCFRPHHVARPHRAWLPGQWPAPLCALPAAPHFTTARAAPGEGEHAVLLFCLHVSLPANLAFTEIIADTLPDARLTSSGCSDPRRARREAPCSQGNWGLRLPSWPLPPLCPAELAAPQGPWASQ